MNYKIDMFITYKGDTYLIIDVIEMENFNGLLCQKDNSNKIEMIEIPTIQ